MTAASLTQDRPQPRAWWSLDAAALCRLLDSSVDGLTQADAQARLARDGPNAIELHRRDTAWQLLWRQLRSPLVLILVAGALVSTVVGDWIDATTILVIVAGSVALGYAQESRAAVAVDRLRSRLALTARVRRDSGLRVVPAAALVAGDVIELAAGNLVPADGVVLRARDFLVTEAALTGESLPVEKQAGTAAPDAALPQRRNCVFLGSSVRSGTASVLLVRTGRDTVLADVAARIGADAPETEFGRGLRRFGELLLRVMLLVVVGVLAVNQLLGRPAIESLLFAVALAVGLSPELLPAIVTVSLARGARRLAADGVLVRRLEAIENLGGMDVLCTDKTGTLTRGTMALHEATDALGVPSAEVLQLAYLNAAMETGIENPLDEAVMRSGVAAGLGTDGWRKVDEIPYDFVRRRLTIVAAAEASATCLLVTKGAFAHVLQACTRVAVAGAEQPLDELWRERLRSFAQSRGEQGVRVLALATRTVPLRASYAAADEVELVFRGFLCFDDPPKPQALRTVADLAKRGVRVKIVTGDNRHVAAHLGAAVGLDPTAILTGEQLTSMRDESLWHLAERTDLFVEVDPAQKERIVRALQHSGHAVGFLGDGINDAPALHSADVGISVDQAVDVARESADIVLLQPDLDVLHRGVEEGRRTFANTLKYIQITTSANFGNMISMAIATPLLPFLPLTATQILLNNFLSDLPSMAIAADRVDAADLARPRRWDLARVRRFMIVFGLVSSVFDLLTFALLRLLFDAGATEFRSGWFVVSLLTELAVVLVLRTRGAAWRSRPAPALLGITLAVAVLAVALPWAGPLARLLGLAPMPLTLVLALLGVTAAYLVATEWTKVVFNRHPAR